MSHGSFRWTPSISKGEIDAFVDETLAAEASRFAKVAASSSGDATGPDHGHDGNLLVRILALLFEENEDDGKNVETVSHAFGDLAMLVDRDPGGTVAGIDMDRLGRAIEKWVFRVFPEEAELEKTCCLLLRNLGFLVAEGRTDEVTKAKVTESECGRVTIASLLRILSSPSDGFEVANTSMEALATISKGFPVSEKDCDEILRAVCRKGPILIQTRKGAWLSSVVIDNLLERFQGVHSQIGTVSQYLSRLLSEWHADNTVLEYTLMALSKVVMWSDGSTIPDIISMVLDAGAANRERPRVIEISTKLLLRAFLSGSIPPDLDLPKLSAFLVHCLTRFGGLNPTIACQVFQVQEELIFHAVDVRRRLVELGIVKVVTESLIHAMNEPLVLERGCFMIAALAFGNHSYLASGLNAVDALLGVVTQIFLRYRNEIKLATAASTALWSLLKDNYLCQARLSQTEVLRGLIEMLLGWAQIDEQYLRPILACIGSAAQFNANNIIQSEEGVDAARMMGEIITSGFPSPNLLEEALTTAYYLCLGNRRSKSLVVAIGALEVVVDRCASDPNSNGMLVVRGFRLAAILVFEDAQAGDLLLRKDVVPVVLSTIDDFPGGHYVLAAAYSLLINLFALSEIAIEGFVSAGGIQKAVASLNEISEEGAHEAIMRLVSFVASVSVDAIVVITEETGISWILSELESFGDMVEVVTPTLRLITHLARNFDVAQDLLAEKGGIELILETIQRLSGSSSICGSGWMALAALVRANSGNLEIVHTIGSLSLLRQCMDDHVGSSEVQRACANFLVCAFSSEEISRLGMNERRALYLRAARAARLHGEDEQARAAIFSALRVLRVGEDGRGGEIETTSKQSGWLTLKAKLLASIALRNRRSPSPEDT